MDVALIGRTEATLLATAAEAREVGVRTLVARADVAVGSEIRRAAERIIADLGPPQVVVNNAGVVGRKAPIEETSETEWDAVMGPNLKGVFLVTRELLPSMRAAGRGRFVTVASISATLGTAGLAAYCASKWGALGPASTRRSARVGGHPHGASWWLCAEDVA
jgi:3-oxoacyl-[acyl-carrier protein] reductase